MIFMGMNEKDIKSVPFDPGITQYYPPLEDDIIYQISHYKML